MQINTLFNAQTDALAYNIFAALQDSYIPTFSTHTVDLKWAKNHYN